MSPNESSTVDNAVITRLSVENAAWQALLNVMSKEEQALADGDADQLPELNTSKLSQLQTLNNLVRARNDSLIAEGLSPDHAGMDAWLTQYGQPEHHLRWQRLLNMEHEAQALNQRIGSLIDLRLGSTRQALNVLIHSATSQGGLYDQAGQSVAARNGRPLTAA
jgi:flagella synthesis protein FlgN